MIYYPVKALFIKARGDNPDRLGEEIFKAAIACFNFKVKIKTTCFGLN